MTRKVLRILNLLVALSVLTAAAGIVWAQGGSRGTVVVTVTDPNGLVVPGAKLTLVDLKFKDARSGETLNTGIFAFPGLLSGTYKLTVEKPGFETESYDAVVVEAARTTDIAAKLKIGSNTTQVEVIAENSPLIETTASSIGTNFDVKDLDDLPLSGRDATQLVNYVPGAAISEFGGPIFNGMRAASQTAAVDGVVANSSREKDYGDATPAQEARIENVDEVVVQTDQLDLNQGYGQANMQSYFNTRRGGEKYHGRVYGNLTNSRLGAFGFKDDYYIAMAEQSGESASKAVAYANEQRSAHHFVWGPSVGGPIPIPHYKDRLFFFASYTQEDFPGNTTITSVFPALGNIANPQNGSQKQADLQSGIYSYTDTNGNIQTVNLFSQAAAANTSLGLSLPTSVNSVILSELTNINSSITSSSFETADGGDPFNLTDESWGYPASSTNYFPTVRVDYDATPNLRINFAYNESKYVQPYAVQPPYQGSTFDAEAGSAKSEYYTGALGVEWTISPRLLNQFHGGYLYFFNGTFAKTGNEYLLQDLVGWNSMEYLTGSGQTHLSPLSNLYPLASFSDNMVYQHGAHNMQFGVSGYREQDHYWNPPLGWDYYFVGNLAAGDPAINAFQSYDPSVTPSAIGLPNASYSQTQIAQAFYGLLTGRIDGYWNPGSLNVKTGTFGPGSVVLDEVQQGFGVFAQDSWRVQPSLTINYGLRWDFTGDDHDVNGIYHTVSPNDIWGPSGYMNQFNPGSFKNNDTPSYNATEHAYAPWHVSPQPSLGVAWNPNVSGGFLGKLLGGSSTVIRAGYALRNYTESYQNFWNYASNGGSFFGNNHYSNPETPVNGVQPYGTFAPGSVSLGTTFPADDIGVDVSTYEKSITEESLAFNFGGPEGMNPHIRQPYIQSWNLGIQRALGRNNAIEIRYIGNNGMREWIPINANEVNVFENGFLKEFKIAQANLAASGGTSFADNANDMPIMTAAFGGDASQWSNGSFIANLQNGQVGDFAETLTQAGYLCNLVGNFVVPCQTNAGLAGKGVGAYPSNIFQANPYASGSSAEYLDAEGSSNYHSLQVEFRQKDFHGANFTANYTFSKNLGVRPVRGGDSSNFSLITLRNPHLAYSPTDSDIRQTFHLLGTYDLPFGKGRAFFATSKLMNEIVGGWTVGTVTTYQSGSPFLLTGGNHTFNNFTDGGVVLNGVTLHQLRSAVGVYHNWANGNISFINPKYVSTKYLTPNTTPGTLGLRPWLWGPNVFTSDASLTKVWPIRDSFKFSLQSEFYNVFNHTTWGTGLNGETTSLVTQSSTNVANIGSGFAQSSASGGPRHIEIRANIEF